MGTVARILASGTIGQQLGGWQHQWPGPRVPPISKTFRSGSGFLVLFSDRGVIWGQIKKARFHDLI